MTQPYKEGHNSKLFCSAVQTTKVARYTLGCVDKRKERSTAMIAFDVTWASFSAVVSFAGGLKRKGCCSDAIPGDMVQKEGLLCLSRPVPPPTAVHTLSVAIGIARARKQENILSRS